MLLSLLISVIIANKCFVDSSTHLLNKMIGMIIEFKFFQFNSRNSLILIFFNIYYEVKFKKMCGGQFQNLRNSGKFRPCKKEKKKEVGAQSKSLKLL